MKVSNLFALFAVSLLVTACNDDKPETESTDQSNSPLDSFLVAEAPASPAQISSVFADPTPGKEIVLSGEVMGRMDTFIDGRAMVVLGDPTKITPCNRIPGDSCPTPWDVCCDDPDVIKKSIATVQFLDENGRVMKAGLKGYQGIKELSFLTVKGKIAEGSNENNLLVTASAFHVTDPSPYIDAPPIGDYVTEEDGEIIEDDDVFIYIKKK